MKTYVVGFVVVLVGGLGLGSLSTLFYYYRSRSLSPQVQPTPTPQTRVLLSIEYVRRPRQQVATLVLDTQGLSVQAVQTVLKYNPQKVTVSEIVNPGFFSDLLEQDMNSQSGEISLTLAIKEGDAAISGKVPVVGVIYSGPDGLAFTLDEKATVLATGGQPVPFELISK